MGNQEPTTNHVIPDSVYLLHQPFAHRAIGRAVATALSQAGFNVYLDDKFHAPDMLPSNHDQRRRELMRRPIGVCIVSDNILRLDQQSQFNWFRAEMTALCQYPSQVFFLTLTEDTTVCDPLPAHAAVLLANSPRALTHQLGVLISQLPVPRQPQARQRPIVPALPQHITSDYLFEQAYSAYWRYEVSALSTHLETVLQHNPDHFGAMVLYCRLLVDRKRLAEALELTYRLEVLEKNDLWVYSHRASILMYMGRYEEAQTLYDQMLQRQPNAASLWAGRANLLLHRGDTERAHADVEQAIAISPHHTYYHLRGQCYVGLRNFAAAVKDFEAVKLRRPNWSRNLAALAVALIHLGRNHEAQQIWQGLLEIDPLYLQLDYLADAMRWPPMMKQAAIPAMRVFNGIIWEHRLPD